ncbi:MAG TPA: hypothetical protein VEC13_02715 [Candidatus Paceibacterota bacterium]|nr:hypothetical protein [Candidatus Paceibacterota bacterium]
MATLNEIDLMTLVRNEDDDDDGGMDDEEEPQTPLPNTTPWI